MSARFGVTAFARFAVPTLIFAPLLLAAPHPAWAQRGEEPSLRVASDSSVVQQVDLVGGSRLLGRIVEISDGTVTFLTLEGIRLTFPVSQVLSVRVLDGARHGDDFWPRDPSDSRLFIGPTARVTGDRRGYAGVYELIFPSAAIGITDWGMVSGGMSIIPGLALSDQFFYISPKLRFLGLRGLDAAAGVLWVTIADSEKSAGMVYGVATVGNEVVALTAGPAFPFVSDGGFTDEMLGLVGAEVRVSRGVKVITENWFVPDGEGAFLTFGLRGLAGRSTIELAALVPTDSDIIVPLASFSVTW